MLPSVYSSNKQECRFYPVQCSDATFKTLRAQEGHVYFVTDKKKLFLGKGNEMIPMCANSGIFYGHKPIEYDNSGNKPDPDVVFSIDDIEGDDLPEKDDLILNIGTDEFPDGCFYRVNNVVDDIFETTRLTLQGTGGGGGGSSSGGSSANFSISIVGDKAKVFSSSADAMNISFKGYYNGTEENRITQVSFTKKGEDEPFYTVNKDLPFNEEHSIDLINHMNQFNFTSTTVIMAVQDLYGNQRSTNFTVQIVELVIKPTKDPLLFSSSSNFIYSCHLAGATSGVQDKKLIFNFYEEQNLNKVVYTQTKDLAVHDEGTVQTNLDLSSLSHGVYVVKVTATAKIRASSDNVLSSNELIHKIGHFVKNDPLLMISTPEVTEQYTNIPVYYLLVTSDTNKKPYTLDISLDGKEKTQLTIYSNTFGEYPLYFETKGTYTLSCSVVELALFYSQYLLISGYTGNLPVIDPQRDDLMLYLNPRGKSNNATDRDQWKDYNGIYTAQLNNFHYGKSNGWLMDENGISYLSLTSGASLILDDFLPFKSDPTKFGPDSRMGYGMTVELDFEVSGVLDYNAELIKCISTNKDNIIQTGFVITGDKVKFYNSRLNDSLNDKGERIGALMSQNIVENKRIRLSFVIEPNTGLIEYPMCYTYLNGKLSAAVIYSSGDTYKDSTDNPAKLRISSESASIKIYGIRFYSSSLTDRIILNNYTASLPTIEERQERYDTNSVFNASNEIDYSLVAAEGYDLQIPYMKITGGWSTEENNKWQLQNQTNAKVGLPTGKKDYRLIDVEVKYPKNEYFADYEDYKFVNQFASGKPMAQAYGEKPSNGGAIMYAQGTSSMEYPVKNLRLRFKNEKDWYVVRPDISPVEIICMKADYMESSGSHNTGAANLIDTLYSRLGIKTPGQEVFGGEGKDTIVTCIKGHPCLIFYSETGEAGSYKYIGKYNLNLDKATPEPFGFNHTDDFGYLAPGDKYYAVQYDDDGTKFVGQQKPSSGGKYVKDQIETEKTVAEGEKINSVHCFEFLDNAVKVCNFLAQPGYTYEQTWYNTFDGAPGWTKGFESRYPEDRVGYHDADMLYPLASWLNELYTIRMIEESEGKSPADIHYTYRYTQANSYEEGVAYYIETEQGSYVEAYPTRENFNLNNYYTRSIETSRFEMNSLERFKREYETYFDKDFLLTYYLVTEALLMVDSRVKNMMIATWGKQQRNYKNLSGETITTNNYIFYPIFYDMDTMLGLDNTGVYSFEYSDEDTDPQIYNGNEVLWNFVRDSLSSELATWYTRLESAKFNADDILPYFNDNQANMANEAFYNGDAFYKYVSPAREGYYDYLNKKEILPGEGPFLYAAQGDRSLMRERFLVNRIRFLCGKYNSNIYQSGNRIEFRWYYPTGTESDAALNASSRAVPPDGTFNLTSLKTGFAGIKLGANGKVYNERFVDKETKEINLPEASGANGTEAYILGLNNLTDLGDLSNKYMQKFIIASSDVRLKNLTLGNPHKDYHNPYWRSKEDAQSQKIGLSGCSYLETFNLQNCAAYNSVLDFSSCPAIQQILLTGSSTSEVILPTNGMVSELRLPSTVTTIDIDTHSALTVENFSIGGYDYNGGTKIGEKGYYTNDFSKIKKLFVIDTPIDTYEMVRQAGNLEAYYLRGINWNITADDTQYCARSQSEYDPNKTYYYYDSVNGRYLRYTGTSYPAEGKLYEKLTMLENGKVVCIPVLEYLQTKDLKNGVNGHAEALSGTITLDIDGASADELEIYQRYAKIYPEVKIKYSGRMDVEGAYRINFYRIDVDSLNGGDLSDIEPYFSALTDGSYSLAELINNPAFSEPVKSSTNTTNYTFSRTWYDWADSQQTVYYQDNCESIEEDCETLFSKVYPSKNMNLVPKFSSSVRYYTVNFYNYDYDPDNKEAVIQVRGEFEDTLLDLVKNEPKAFYLYRDDSQLPNFQRYAFKGWQHESDFNNSTPNPTVIDLANTKVYSDVNYFAYYTTENASEVISDLVLFDFKDTSLRVMNESYPVYCISIKPEYQSLVGGKITLPTFDKNGRVIYGIENFSATSKITEVYFLDNAQYTIVGPAAFADSGITVAHLPSTIQHIGANAFRYAYNLEQIALSDSILSIGDEAFMGLSATSCLKVHIDRLPENLVYLGQRSFYNCGPNVTISSLPSGITKVPAQCFMSAPSVTINELPAKDPGVECTIGTQAFAYNSNNNTVTTFTINAPWVFDGAPISVEKGYQIFFNGYYNMTDVYVYGPMASVEDLSYQLFGDDKHDHVSIHAIQS